MLRPLLGALATSYRCISRVLALSLFAFLLYPSVRPAYADVAVGSSAGNFLGFEIGGRPSGMGGAQVGSAPRGSRLSTGPPRSPIRQPQVSAMHAAVARFELRVARLRAPGQPPGLKVEVGLISLRTFIFPASRVSTPLGNPTGDFRCTTWPSPRASHDLGARGLCGRKFEGDPPEPGDRFGDGTRDGSGRHGFLPRDPFGAVAQNLGPRLLRWIEPLPAPHQLRFWCQPRGPWRPRPARDRLQHAAKPLNDDLRVGAEIAPTRISPRASGADTSSGRRTIRRPGFLLRARHQPNVERRLRDDSEQRFRRAFTGFRSDTASGAARSRGAGNRRSRSPPSRRHLRAYGACRHRADGAEGDCA